MTDVIILVGDAIEQLKTIDSDSIDCVVTSPPYWGLRDYGTATWIDGDEFCDHLIAAYQGKSSAVNGKHQPKPYKEKCGKCGAIREDKQLGLEPTIEEHLEAILEVFAEIHRVLKPEGTVWVNYGDCYASSPNGRKAADIVNDNRAFRDKPFSTIQGVFKPKDLCMVPNRFAIAMQEWGWWVRSEIIWAKPNPMPESANDRPSTAHEKIFVFTKNPKYFWDKEAVKRPCSPNTHARLSQNLAAQEGSHRANGGGKTNGPMRAVIEGSTRKLADESQNYSKRKGSLEAALSLKVDKRNIRNYEPARFEVWEMATQSFKGAHFATFPEELARRCIAAGCPIDGIVLDPFGGAGTTGLAAKNLGRQAILIELSPEYAQLAADRLRGKMCVVEGVEQATDAGPLFNETEKFVDEQQETGL